MSGSTQDRIQEIKREALPGRLRLGAEALGSLWRAGGRCPDLWAVPCSCGASEGDFCRAKVRWAGLLLEWYGGLWPRDLTGREPYAIVEAMRVDPRWWEATGLTALVEIPGGQAPIRVGPRGTSWKTVEDLDLIPAGPGRDEAMRAVERIQKVFDGKA